MSGQESSSRARLEIVFKVHSRPFVSKSCVGNEIPRFEFTRVGRAAGVVVGKALSQIRRKADVALVRRKGTFEYVKRRSWRVGGGARCPLQIVAKALSVVNNHVCGDVSLADDVRNARRRPAG